MSDVEQMIDAPTPHARIWLTPPCCGNYEHGEVTWCQDAVNECGNCGAPPTEYVPAARLDAVTAERDGLRAALTNPPKHVWWGAGEPDCPPDIVAGNGELHTLRCKVCGKGLSDGRICLAGIVK